MTARFEPSAEHDLIAAIRRAARQEQFLEVVSAEEARERFARHLDLSPLPAETVVLAAALGRVLAHDVIAPIDVPPFDRANVDGFALRAADSAGAADGAPKQIALNPEVIACGHAPKIEVKPGTATTIATGGVVPRGADAVVMIEHTELIESIPAIELRRGAAAGTRGARAARRGGMATPYRPATTRVVSPAPRPVAADDSAPDASTPGSADAAGKTRSTTAKNRNRAEKYKRAPAQIR